MLAFLPHTRECGVHAVTCGKEKLKLKGTTYKNITTKKPMDSVVPGVKDEAETSKSISCI